MCVCRLYDGSQEWSKFYLLFFGGFMGKYQFILNQIFVLYFQLVRICFFVVKLVILFDKNGGFYKILSVLYNVQYEELVMSGNVNLLLQIVVFKEIVRFWEVGVSMIFCFLLIFKFCIILEGNFGYVRIFWNFFMCVRF